MKTTAVNKYKEAYDIYIGRGSKWGNPFQMKNKSEEERDRVCNEYENWFYTTDLINDILELKGKKLGCFCKPARCHGDFLAKMVNFVTEREDPNEGIDLIKKYYDLALKSGE